MFQQVPRTLQEICLQLPPAAWEIGEDAAAASSLIQDVVPAAEGRMTSEHKILLPAKLALQRLSQEKGYAPSLDFRRQGPIPDTK